MSEAYSEQLTATGDANVTWAITDGSAPDHVTLSSSGLLSGTPDTAGVYNFTVRATNTAGTADAAFSLSIANVTSGAARIIRGRVTLRGRVIQ